LTMTTTTHHYEAAVVTAVIAILMLIVAAVVAVVHWRKQTSKAASADQEPMMLHCGSSVEIPNVSFLTDIEGNWEYFERFVQQSAALSFPGDGQPRFSFDGAADVVLEDGWCFIHGGDTCDKGGAVGGSVRVVRTLVKLKRKYPHRVVLLLGNRDINKMRMTSELNTTSSWYQMKNVQEPHWVPPAKRITPEKYLRAELAKKLGCLPDEVPVETLEDADTLPNRIKWMFKETMGAAGEFERRAAEIALLRKLNADHVNPPAADAEDPEVLKVPPPLGEEETAQEIIRSVCAGGFMRDLIELGQLGYVHDDILFVHGGLIGGPWTGANDEDKPVSCLGYVPGRNERIGDVVEWVQALNEWKQEQVAEWLASPCWDESVAPARPRMHTLARQATGKLVTASVPSMRRQSTESMLNVLGVSEPPPPKAVRGGDRLMKYVIPGCEPSVVMGRHLTSRGMPMPMPMDLVAQLNANNINKLAIGHTPHGNAPTMLKIPGAPHMGAPAGASGAGVLMVMGDTSYSDMSCKDARGTAVSEVQFRANGSVAVQGVLHDQREISFLVPDENLDRIGCVIPAIEVPETAIEHDAVVGDVGFSPKMAEAAVLEQLDGKPHFVKAWLPEDHQYLLCNVDGFCVSYVTLNAAELDIIFRKLKHELQHDPERVEILRRGVPAEDADRLQNAKRKKAKAKAQSPAFVAISSTTADDPPGANATDDKAVHKMSSKPASRFMRKPRAEVTICSLGDTDVIGLNSRTTEYANTAMRQQLRQDGCKLDATARKLLLAAHIGAEKPGPSPRRRVPQLAPSPN